MHETISLICTVRDEADNIAHLLDSMLAQTRLPEEIVINDCGSCDATAAIVRSYAEREPRIRLVAGGHNIPSGRNNAIAAAHGTLIACTDAGLVLDRHWLERIIAPLEAGHADFVGGFFSPCPHTLFELALGATNYRLPEEIDPARFLPFGKSLAFRKDMWADIGGFPEWASHCEDLLFDQAALRAGYRLTFCADALVFFRPRPSLGAFARQYFFYARGDGIGNLWTSRHIIRYATYSTLLLILDIAKRYPATRWFSTLLLALGAYTYTRAPYRRLLPQIHNLTWFQRLYVLSLVPVIRVVGDCAKMVGYPVGVYKRMRRRNL